MTLSNREIWVFMQGAHEMSGKGNEEIIQVWAKYNMICRNLGITPLSAKEIAELRLETITTIGGAAEKMQKQDIWQKPKTEEQ